jgi:Holliday junction resolvase
MGLRRTAVNTSKQGRDLENAVKALLSGRGWTCMRAAGSKGVADVVAIPSRSEQPWLLVQCKLTNPNIGPGERLALTTLATPCKAVPLVASRGDRGEGTRVQYQKDTGMWVVFRELTGPGPKEWTEWDPALEWCCPVGHTHSETVGCLYEPTEATYCPCLEPARRLIRKDAR